MKRERKIDKNGDIHDQADFHVIKFSIDDLKNANEKLKRETEGIHPFCGCEQCKHLAKNKVEDARDRQHWAASSGRWSLTEPIDESKKKLLPSGNDEDRISFDGNIDDGDVDPRQIA